MQQSRINMTSNQQDPERRDEKLTYEQLSIEWDVPKSTLYAWVHRRQIPFIRLGKRLVRFSRKAIEQWERERSIQPK